jgi:hypothetical protein
MLESLEPATAYVEVIIGTGESRETGAIEGQFTVKSAKLNSQNFLDDLTSGIPTLESLLQASLLGARLLRGRSLDEGTQAITDFSLTEMCSIMTKFVETKDTCTSITFTDGDILSKSTIIEKIITMANSNMSLFTSECQESIVRYSDIISRGNCANAKLNISIIDLAKGSSVTCIALSGIDSLLAST